MKRLEKLFGTTAPVAVVTGSGAPRVGNCVARTLAARGYRLVVHANRSTDSARETVDSLREQGCAAMACQADVSQEQDVRRMIREVLAQFGRVDVVVNSAAIWKAKPLEEVRSEDVREHFEVNALGMFLCCQLFGLLMVTQRTGGVIINVGDWAVARPYLDYPAYFPSKGAVPTMTRNFAVELAERNPRVRVNAVLPGPVMLPDSMPSEERRAVINATLVRREGRAQHVADAAVALIENDFITAVCLPVDGGRRVKS